MLDKAVFLVFDIKSRLYCRCDELLELRLGPAKQKSLVSEQIEKQGRHLYILI